MSASVQHGEYTVSTQRSRLVMALWVLIHGALFLLLLLGSMSFGMADVVLISIGVSAIFLGFMMLIRLGRIEFDENAIRFIGLWRRHAIAWSDVLSVRVDGRDKGADAMRMLQRSETIALCGKKRRLVLPGPAQWNQENKHTVLALMERHLEQRGIGIERSALTTFLFSR